MLFLSLTRFDANLNNSGSLSVLCHTDAANACSHSTLFRLLPLMSRILLRVYCGDNTPAGVMWLRSSNRISCCSNATRSLLPSNKRLAVVPSLRSCSNFSKKSALYL
ncbi:hypothetical protein D3C84_561680 [compost metagenome]